VAPRIGVVATFLNTSYDSSCPNGRNSSVALICDDNTGVLNLASSTNCSLAFEWPTVYACPLCSSTDFTTSYSTCVNNSQNLIYSYSAPKYCHDGAQPPAPVPQNCTTCTAKQYSFTYNTDRCGLCDSCAIGKRQKSFFWVIPKVCKDGIQLPPSIIESCVSCSLANTHFVLSECENNQQTKTYNWLENRTCIDGIELPNDEVVPCVEPWKFGSKIVIGVSISATLLVIILGAILIKLYIKNRKLYGMYSKLKEQNAGEATQDDPFDNTVESKSDDDDKEQGQNIETERDDKPLTETK
jgi:hypothetical protein